MKASIFRWNQTGSLGKLGWVILVGVAAMWGPFPAESEDLHVPNSTAVEKPSGIPETPRVSETTGMLKTKVAPADPESEEEKKLLQQQEDEVVRAVLDLQNKLGGSLVQKSKSLQPLEQTRPHLQSDRSSPRTDQPEHCSHPKPCGLCPYALQRLTTQGPRRPNPSNSPHRLAAQAPRLPAPLSSMEHTRENYPRKVTISGPPMVQPHVPSNGNNRVVLLRETASDLGQTADRLEWANLYDQADQIREIADKLRLQARNLINSNEPDFENR